ncbi:MAG TPA: altronate hydrolase [bacterium]|nr:altronate hydrolase [bacterium]
MLPFERCALLPAPGDNAAVATRRLAAGTEIVVGDRRIRLVHTVLEGHRFVFAPVAKGAALLSWGLPFGDALRDLAPGDYLCNARTLQALGERSLDFALPDAPNFRDRFRPFVFAERLARCGSQVAPVASPGTFRGYRRPGGRGVGTRNCIVVLGLTSRDAALATAVAARARRELDCGPETCEVAAVTHTEGGGRRRPHNLEFVLRALAGFVVHPNTGAVVVLDHGEGAFDGDDLERFLRGNGYPLDAVPHAFVRIGGDFAASVERAMKVLRRLFREARTVARSEEPLAELRIALQCGGSDAFSGVSGNVLAGLVARELIRHGGAANLAETDELIGAESYVLENVRRADVARRFVDKIAAFQARAERHGASAEGNPSGGNTYRGLYNITLKSLGAARKKAPDVRLDGVLDYGEPMPGAGYWFMDSPGNDLESIAGQVASGCNLILFITGNGSVTNFPFVPTLKFVTTTARFERMTDEMDVNAGRYNDGESMTELVGETFAMVGRVASGARTKGERAGHAQVSLWRDWRRGEDQPPARPVAVTPRGEPLPVRSAAPLPGAFRAQRGANGPCCQRLALVMPTSLCSGQVAEGIAAELNRRGVPASIDRFVALAHTEGCGAANAEDLYLETLLGHLRHPSTQRALLLEHGCEKTHNDAIRRWLKARGVDPTQFGFASVQLDGGVARACDRAAAWFAEHLAALPVAEPVTASVGDLRLALFSDGDVADELAVAFGELACGVVAAGGLVVVPEGDGLWRHRVFPRTVLADAARNEPTLAYGQFAEVRGLHVMAAPTADASEIVTGLGGTGVELVIAARGGTALQAHPMVPMLTCGVADGIDLHVGEVRTHLLDRVLATCSGDYVPCSARVGNVRFQLPRGAFGVSL